MSESVRRHIVGVVGGVGLVVLVWLGLITGPAAAQQAPGQHVYDRAGALTPAEIADLEARAAAVEEAGAPVVVYLQARDADYPTTVDDARALMDAWAVESRPGARDGLVLFLNLRPDDPRRGQAVIYAGQARLDGRLSRSEVDRIYQQSILPELRAGRIAAGLGAGLDAAQARLTGSPIVWPLNALALAFGLALIAAAARALIPGRLGARSAPTTIRPADLAPALAGALAWGRIDRRLAVATLLGLVRRGALEYEPASGREPRIRLVDRSRTREKHEAKLWDELMARAHADGTVDGRGLAWALNSWPKVAEVLLRDLQARGWYQPDPARARLPFRVFAAVALVLAVVCLATTFVAGEPAALIGGLVFGLTAIGSFLLGNRLPETTPAGEAAARPWRAYRAGLGALGRDDPDALKDDDTLPDAFALLDDDALRRTGSPAATVDEPRPAFVQRSAGWEFAPFWLAYAYESRVASSAHHGGGIGIGAGGYDGGVGGGASVGGGDGGGSF